jgi:hypothetical protein
MCVGSVTSVALKAASPVRSAGAHDEVVPCTLPAAPGRVLHSRNLELRLQVPDSTARGDLQQALERVLEPATSGTAHLLLRIG